MSFGRESGKGYERESRMEYIKLSILIPTYNTEAYISRCLESVCMQKQDFVEIVVVNDGSTDDTERKIERFSKHIKYYCKQNEGVGAARNQLLDLTKGEYIWFVDSDDYLFEHCVERIMSELNADKTIDMLTILHNDVVKDVFFEGKGEDYILNNLFNGYLWNKVIKRKIIEDNNIRFIPNMYSQEDWLFLFKVYPYLQHIKETDIRAYCYCDDNLNSVMRKPTRKNVHRNVENSLRTICYFKSFVEDYQGKSVYKPYHSWLNYSIAGFLFSLLSLDYSQREVKAMINILQKYRIYPVGKSNNLKANFFLQLANCKWLYLLMVRLWKKINFREV